MFSFAKYKFNTMSQELIFQLALSLIKGLGPITAKKLIAYCGGPEAVFKEKIANLKKIPTIGNVLAKEIQNPQRIYYILN